MKLINLNTLEEFEGEIIEIDEVDYKKIKASRQFQFKWDEEKNNHVFKIVRADDETEKILGLISLVDIPEEFRIHVNLLENAKDNRGKSKQIDRVAGCLLAFAAQIAFEKGYMGFISLVPKTVLIKLYVDKYGFSQYGRQLAIEGRAAINLIKKYL